MGEQAQPYGVDWEFKERDLKILRELAADPRSRVGNWRAC